jgi:hypothetical protein
MLDESCAPVDEEAWKLAFAFRELMQRQPRLPASNDPRAYRVGNQTRHL